MNEKFFIKERYMRNGALSLPLLTPELGRFVSRMGYYDKETCCKVFDFVAQLLRENMVDPKGVALKNVAPKGKTKKATLPHKDDEGSAKPASNA